MSAAQPPVSIRLELGLAQIAALVMDAYAFLRKYRTTCACCASFDDARPQIRYTRIRAVNEAL